MKKEACAGKYYLPSENVVAREIEGELIIIPLVSGMGDVEEELFTLNDTGKAIWNRLNGKKNLEEVSRDLSKVFKAPPGEIRKDVIGLVKELLKRKMLVEIKNGQAE